MCKNGIVCQQDHDHALEIPPSPTAILPQAIPVAKKQRVNVIKNRETPMFNIGFSF
jgi:hypothetical protein